MQDDDWRGPCLHIIDIIFIISCTELYNIDPGRGLNFICITIIIIDCVKPLFSFRIIIAVNDLLKLL